ncbi:MAG TPA: hypothetical protein VGJ79_07505 [Candidatus Dormibacteraeota bacterium]
MLKIWSASNFRRTLGGLCLIVAPAVQLVAMAMSPKGAGTANGVLQSAVQENGRFIQSDYLNILSGILFIPAFFAILHVVRGRGVVLAHIGVALALIGMVLFVFVSGGANLMVGVMGSPGLDSSAMTSLIQRALGGTSAVTATWLGLYVESLGFFLIGIAVWRSRFGYRWAGALISLWIVADFVTPVQNDIVDGLIGVIGIFGLGAIGYRILVMSDSSWELAPSQGSTPLVSAVRHEEGVPEASA